MQSIPDLPSDETLVAFIDGELEKVEHAEIEALVKDNPAVLERLTALMRSTLPFRSAFEPLLDQAPIADLRARIDNATNPDQDRLHVSRRQFLAAAAACIAVGMTVGGGFHALYQSLQPDQDPNWRAVVANYMMLYSPETLGNLPRDPSFEQGELARIAETMGLGLSPQSIEIPNVPFKRAQILRFKGKPLAQIAYLDPTDGPLALCFTRSSSGAAPVQTEQRLGLNIVYWSTSTHAFLVIGRGDIKFLQNVAEHFSANLPA
jgi:hypothetical protein